MTAFVIVGAGLAGAKAAETLRAEGFEGRVLLIGSETERPYERPPLSKGLLLGTAGRDEPYVHDLSWYGEQQIELRTGVTVRSIDPAAHTVRTEAGEEIGYDKRAEHRAGRRRRPRSRRRCAGRRPPAQQRPGRLRGR